MPVSPGLALFPIFWVAVTVAVFFADAAMGDDDSFRSTYLDIADAVLLKQMCEKNAQPLSDFPSCAARILHRDGGAGNGYEIGANPEAIPCGNEFGDVWAPDYQLGSCCSGDGRYFVMTGQVAGFDFGYETPNPSEQCVGYARALQAIVCSPWQGQYIVDGKLRVCKDSCDAVFKACGAPGENFPSWTSYTDGETLCTEAWGGFGSLTADSSCGRPESFFCEQGIGIEVVNGTDAEECLSMIRPNFDLAEAPEFDYLKNKYCPTSSDPNIDLESPCQDVIWALNNQQGRRAAGDEECNIPMYARSEGSRRNAIDTGCYSGACRAGCGGHWGSAMLLGVLVLGLCSSR